MDWTTGLYEHPLPINNVCLGSSEISQFTTILVTHRGEPAFPVRTLTLTTVNNEN